MCSGERGLLLLFAVLGMVGDGVIIAAGFLIFRVDGIGIRDDSLTGEGRN